MIKTRINNEYKDVVKIFGGGTLQKEIIKVWSGEAHEYVYESSVEYTGSIPITINANGDALIDYRIYGASGGVGESTENLFDKNTITPNSFFRGNGEIGSSPLFSISDFIPVENGDYLVYRARSGYSGPCHCVYDENKIFVRSVQTDVYTNTVITIGDGEKYIRITVNSDESLGRLDACIVIKGTTAPTEYEPYGYKLPMIVNNGITNIVPPAPAETKTSNGITVTSDGKGTYTISGTTTKGVTINFGFDHSISCGSKNTAALLNDFAKSGMTFSYDGQEGVFGLNSLNRVLYNVTPIANKNLTGFSFYVDAGVTVNGTISPLIFDGVNITPTEFVPHVPSISYDTPVYIGENQLDSVEGIADYVDKASGKIVRKIWEYTFTGDEPIILYGKGFYTSKVFSDAVNTGGQITTRFSHFTSRDNTTLGDLSSVIFGDDCGCFRANVGNVLLRSTSNFTTAAECKAYLKAQYDNGTPVKINYWLKTPVEEDPPVSFPDIPTIKGETVIDYDGEPKPSQMYVKYRR